MTDQISDLSAEGASKMAATAPAHTGSSAPNPETPVLRKPGDPEVEVTFVFVDAVKHGIKGLDVKLEGGGKSEAVVTGDDGTAARWLDAKRGEPIKIYVKKRTGELDLKGTVTPKSDVNNYTIQSPEYHLEAITKLDAEEQLELDLNIPRVKEGEVMTVERLTGELAPYIASKQVVTEAGKVLRDNPIKKKVVVADPKTKKTKTKIEIEHHYQAVDTKKPRTVVMYVLGSRLNYPTTIEISESQYERMAQELGCEVAAIKAVAKTESNSAAYFPNGLPAILFERHKFFKLTKPANGNHPYSKFPEICNPIPGGYSLPADYGADSMRIWQYERLVKAAQLNRSAAVASCSWGAFQVMGEYWKPMGYNSPEELANECMKSVDGQAKLFMEYIKMKNKEVKIIQTLIDKDWEGFTSYYNGANWKNQNKHYPETMEKAYRDNK
ncbi:N-acetylmuramidase family protein [uncultured Variovorax sp.]|uniref:N-acetylmuramidase family protein n=1 Tax=uncultured Variovorax sp. TaxID=114708 RepID=UPI0025DF13D6|nr:N-acetylmuramidase family protein [uncultured Variovorax sp.]